jgi:alkanesulfonate monooxygenase SsuD/methylene tetrahydromethanopterin reductase-like flavin-dependent oxidoreductase (luciferase family)
MQFYFFHLMPYPYMPEDYLDRYGTSWATIPNSLYDPEVGHKLYNDYLDVFELADRLGYDGICVNEHHQTCYGLMPSPNLMAAALARRTTRAKIAILGNAICLRDHPLRVAEEVAMLDVITKGRIISGFVRGVGDEYTSFSMDPTTSRDRFLEAHDLIVRAWTEPGPFSFEGKHYNFRYVNTWPRPYQQPHPPIWLPSQGSLETVAFAAERRYPYMQVFSPFTTVKRILDEYKNQARNFGYEAPPEQLGWAVPLYVAETDEKAWEEAGPHMDFLFNKLLKRPFHQFFPPGYLTEKSMSRVMGDKSVGNKRHDLRDMNDKGMVLIGSAATVRERLSEFQKEAGIGLLVVLLHFGSLPQDLTMKNVEVFAKEVMPHFRAEVPAASVGG